VSNLSAPINALLEGFYVEDTTVAQIKERGDFGLGTFNYLDGEMVLLDGQIYQIRSDGHVYEVVTTRNHLSPASLFSGPTPIDDFEGSVDSVAFKRTSRQTDPFPEHALRYQD